MIQYRTLSAEEICPALFQNFIRHQVVTKCWRRENRKVCSADYPEKNASHSSTLWRSFPWVIKDDPFIDDWDEKDYQILVSCLKNTVSTGGYVLAAFYQNALKGFVSVEPGIFGGEHRYMDLSSIHISEDMRGMGIGRTLFERAKSWARKEGAGKLYISAHSAVESQAFYQKMGCAEAQLYQQKHVEAEPYDCQLECVL